MLKIDDVVRVKPGVIGAGQTGKILETVEVVNPATGLSYHFYCICLEDGVKAKFTEDLLEKVANSKWRSIDDLWEIEKNI